MPTVNLAGTAPQPEGDDPESTIDFPEESPHKRGGKTTRLLLSLLVVVLLGAGGFYLYQSFSSTPTPPPPARPVQPLAKAPASPEPPPVAPNAAGLPPGNAPGPPAKAEGPAKAGGPGAGVAPPAGASASPTLPATVVPAGPAPPVQLPPAKAGAKGSPPAVASLPPPAASLRPPTTGTVPAPGGFSLQMGAMLNEGNAQKLKQRLEQLGYAATVRKGVANVRRHVVTVGDFPDRSGAEDLAKRLTAQGTRGQVMPAGARYTVEAGVFANEDDAIDLARALQKLNHQPRIQDLQQNATLYQVRVGNYASREEARAKGSELEGKGFRYFIVKN